MPMKDRMEKNKARDCSRSHKEWILAAILFIGAFLAGLAHLESFRGEHSAVVSIEYLYGPAVMMASGKGFINPDYAEYPELKAFLKGQVESFSPDLLPDTVKTAPSTMAAYHRYLLYTVGLVWRICGISWKYLEPMLAFFLAWYALSLYVLFRFFVSRTLAFLSALLLTVSPAVFLLVFDLRDFSKAPFTITLFCILLWLFMKGPTWRQKLLGALFLGITHGLFMGFRQDALIFLPLCVCILVIPVFLKRQEALWKSLSPLFLYVCLFFALAAPMFQHMDGNAQPQHVLVQGFARDRMDQLGMKQTSYQALVSGADYYTFAALSDFAERHSALTTPKLLDDEASSIAGQQWLQEALFLYPADLATRGWAAIWRILRYADAFPPFFAEATPVHQFFNHLHQSFAFFMHRAGLPLTLLAFILLAMRFPGRALFFFSVSSYVLGYTALQAVCRHTFHLSFFPFLVTAWLIQSLAQRFRRHTAAEATTPPLAIKPFGTMLIVLLLCASTIFLPVAVLRWYQTRQLTPLFQSCIDAPRTPLPSTQKELSGWTLFNLDSPEDKEPSSDLQSLYKVLEVCLSPEVQLWHTRGRYFVAEFDGSTEITHLLHLYDSPIPDSDFSQLLPIPKSKESGKVLRYFFPVYELLRPDADETFLFARSRFTGIAVPKNLASQFRGLYEVTLPEDVTHLLSFTSVDQKLPSPLFHTPLCLPDPVTYYHTEHRKMDNTLFSGAAQRFGTEEQLLLYLQAQLILSTKAEDRIRAAHHLMELEHLDGVIEALGETKTKDDSELQQLLEALELMARLSLYGDETTHSLAALDALLLRAPEREASILLMKIEAYERARKKTEALKTYSSYLSRYPHDEDTTTRAHGLLSDGFTAEEKHTFWKELADMMPEQALFFLYLGLAREELGVETQAKEAYHTAFALNPDNAQIAIAYYLTLTETYTIEEFTESLNLLAREDPEHHIFLCERLEREAFYLSEKHLHDKAGSLLILATAYSPDPDRLLLMACQQFTGAGEYARAEEGLLTLLESNYGEEAAEALYITTKLSLEHPDRLNFWQDLHERYPDKKTITGLLHRLSMEEE